MTTVLMVDHSPRNRRYVARILKYKTDYTLVLAENGYAALKKVEEQPPDLILMDLFLPGMDGFELYKILKSRTATAKIPLIVHTAMELDDLTRARISRMKVEGYVEFPISASELIFKIAVALTGPKRWEPRHL